jgi:small subunit ribosomal protein S6
MATHASYDLFVLLDPNAPEDRRAAVVQRVRDQIASGSGTLHGDADWGLRKLAYEIGHRPEAHYHLYQLEASPELVKELEHALAIDDAVIRHRVIRLPKGPPAETPRPGPARQHPGPEDEPSPPGRHRRE